MKRVFILLLVLGSVSLAGCSLPGRAFPGGPSPWLPDGAPNRVYAPKAATQSAPVPVTHRNGVEASES